MTDKLWDFAVARYGRIGVAESCLRLQDNFGADINMLLAAAWLAEQGRGWKPDEVRELIALCDGWREHCILPLRATRRYLKGQIETLFLYEQIKTLELEAEMHQLYRLHAALQSIALEMCAADKEELLPANLHTYFECLDLTRRPPIEADSRPLIEALRA